MKIIIILLTIHCALLTVRCSAQLEGKAWRDSLVKELPRQNQDSNKVDLLCELIEAFVGANPNEALKYGDQALELATKLALEGRVATAHNSMGSVCEQQGDFSKAMNHYKRGLEIFERQKKMAGVAAILCNIGLVYKAQSDNLKALEYFSKALKIDDEEGFKQFAASVTNNIGNIYSDLGDYSKALEYYLKAYEANVSMGSKRGIGIASNNLGCVYQSLKDYDKSLEYFIKALKLNQEIGDMRSVGFSWSNLGSIYTDMKEYATALPYFEMGQKISGEVGDKPALAYATMSIGQLYLAAARDTSSKPASRAGKINIMNELAPGTYQPIVYMPVGKAALLNAAVDHLERALALSKEINTPNTIRDCYADISKAYTLKGDYKKALDASGKMYAIKDSVFSRENKEEILKMSMKNEYDRQRLTDSLKVAEKEKISAINLQKQKSYTYLGIAGVLLLVGFSFFIVKERGKSETARKQSDGLLLNILPEEVAQELKSTGTTTAKHFDNVTVLFTDFVNFTQAGENMSPQNLIDELHNCFKAFDEITGKYNIEKIKTIGDAYLAVCGLPSPDPKHAENAVRAAKEITMFMEDRLGKMGVERTFQVRVGVHSGSVVAGIVGVKKFAYDIWGDTVNTAARMEQHGETGKINISQTTYELVKDKFTCEYRGEVEAKGKGVMKMYFVS
ncbi:MAG: tetratricopeptide repeat protein [Taibaiella sp.]|nr:tetratricopeptide repeat protein [Taibaiella sp.]